MAELFKFPIKVDITEIEELIDQLKHLQTYKMYEGADQTLVDLDDVVKIFADHVGTEVAESERKRGKWIKNDNGTYSCSVCQSWIPKEQHYYARYCLCCGADMRGK